ncbi:MAG: hypothetical protein R3E75_12220 [Steroidobacteraceae bacterium]
MEVGLGRWRCIGAGQGGIHGGSPRFDVGPAGNACRQADIRDESHPRSPTPAFAPASENGRRIEMQDETGTRLNGTNLIRLLLPREPDSLRRALRRGGYGRSSGS